MNNYIEQLRLYQSTNTDAQSVKSNFVVRLEEYDLIIETLKKKKKKQAFQHELLLGRRGSGKSTLLRRLEIGIQEDQKLSSQYHPILFAEEQATIYRLSDLWFETLKEFVIHLDISLDLQPYNQYKDEKKYARYLYDEITRLTTTHKVYPILLLDNFDKIISSMGDHTHILREQLINHNSVKIIGASTRMDEHFWNYEVPFYDYFRIHNLGPLSTTEINRLFNLWGDLMNLPALKNYVNKNKGKIEAIRILTDGLPRTLQFFIRVLISEDTQYSFDYIKMIMDQVTPIYQERLNNLTPPQRKIIAEMAFIWESCPTKTLVEKCRMESKVISAQINQLVSYGIVDKIKTNTKNHLYRISERFFNMWYIVTQGNPSQKRKAKYLTLFLENWYNKYEIQELATTHLNVVEEGKVPYKKAAPLSKALSQSKYIDINSRDRLIENTLSLTDSLDRTDLPKKSREIIDNAKTAFRNKNYERAISLIKEIGNEADGIKFEMLGYCYHQGKKYKEAESNYLKAIEKGNEIDSIYNLAILYESQEKYDFAERYYLKAIEKKDINAIFNLAVLYVNQNKFDLAEKYFLEAINKNENKALFNLALLYHKQKKNTLAESYYLKSIDENDYKSLHNLAHLYNDRKEYALAETYYLKSIDKNTSESLTNLADLYVSQKKYSNAEQYYLKAIDQNVIEALNNLAILYENQRKYDLAEKYYLEAIDKGENKSLYNLAQMYHNQKKYTSAQTYYAKAIKKDIISADDVLISYYNANEKKQAQKMTQDHVLQIQEDVKIFTDVWLDQFDNIETRLKNMIAKSGYQATDNTLTQLLYLNQHQLVLKQFNDPKLGQKLRDDHIIMYYATQLLTKSGDKLLDLKIPIEIKDTVNEFVQKVKDQNDFYNQQSDT